VVLAIDFPEVTLRALPSSGPVGTTFLLAGSYNVPYAEVEFCIASCSSGPSNTSPIYADDRGDVRAYLTTDSDWDPGSYSIITRNVAGRSASTQLSILGASKPTLSVTPASGPAGTSFVFDGADLLPNDNEISVRVNGSVAGTVGSGSEGAWERGPQLPGRHTHTPHGRQRAARPSQKRARQEQRP